MKARVRALPRWSFQRHVEICGQVQKIDRGFSFVVNADWFLIVVRWFADVDYFFRGKIVDEIREMPFQAWACKSRSGCQTAIASFLDAGAKQVIF